jgi:type VI secretion system protein ImpA
VIIIGLDNKSGWDTILNKNLPHTMINAEELLKPISAEKPCGDDLSYEATFQEIETIMRGKPATQFSVAEDPDWKQLSDRCLEMWARSKDLRLATALSLAALKRDGLPAFREGIALVKGLLERYWDSCYPLLDPADNNDPTQRVNIVASLAAQVGTFGDPMRLLERLQEAPLATSTQMGRFGLGDIVRSETGAAGPDGKAAPSAAQIQAAFKDTSTENLLGLNQAVNDSLSMVHEIDDLLTRTVGADQAPDLAELPKQLKEIQRRLAPYLPAGTVAAAPDGNGTATGGGGNSGRGQPISGDIESPDDVVKMIDKICDYYDKRERSSPVPYILKRAARLAKMDFMKIIDDMTPDSVKDIQKITGDKPKEE